MKKRFLILLFLLVHALHAQKYPVQITPVLVPPYLATLSGYSTTMNEKFGLQLYVSDLTLTRRQVYLKLYIEGNGIQATSAPFVEGIAPLFLSGGDAVQLTQADLAPYFKIQNLQGISPAQYGKPLPQGMYKFCAELYDFYSREKIAQKSCAMGYFMVNSPPQLNLPANHESIDSKSFQNIFFSWTPRHISAGNVEYEFTLVELLDPMMPAGSGFFVSRPLYQTTTFSPTFLYGPAEPLLLPGKKYAWRIQARTTSGFGDGASFENEGYSEIFDFTFKGDCDKPQFVLAEPKTNTQVKVSWQQNPNHTHYMMQTRKKGTTEWFEGEGDQPTANINDLEAGQSYEFRVGAYCMDNVLSFSPIVDFTMPAKKSKDFQCGLEPNVDLSNQTRYSGTLRKGQEFMAGDFAVHVLEATGTDTFTGKAWIKVPYLGPIRIAVEFKDIQLNTNLQLIAGEVKTTYDPEWKNVLDINEVVGDVKEVAEAIGDLVAGISELFKKWDDLEEQKKQNKISETDYNKQWKEVYAELEEANNQYKVIVNSPDIPEELKQKVKDLDPVLVDLASNNYTTKGNQTKSNKDKIEAVYKEVESALNNLALDGKLTPPSVTNTNNDAPLEKSKVTQALLKEIETACTVNDGLSIKIGMTKAQNKSGEFYSYCKAKAGTFYYYKGEKYWYINGKWYLETNCNQETCIKVCTKIDAVGTGTYERIILEKGEATVVTASDFVVKTILVDTPLLIFGGGTKASTITLNAIGTITIEILNRREDITDKEALISQVALLLASHGISSETPAITKKVAQQLVEKIENTFKNLKLSKEEVIREVEKMMGKVGNVGDDFFNSAREFVRVKYGQNVLNQLKTKFGVKNDGAASVILQKWGDDGLSILNKSTIKNLDDVANELLRNKIGYRHISSNVSYLDQLKLSGKISKNANNTYFSLDKFDDPIVAIDKMQLNAKATDAIWRLEFDANQIIGKTSFPKGMWNNAEYIEVLTRSYPNFGSGGASQFMTQSEIILKRMINLKTGQIIKF